MKRLVKICCIFLSLCFFASVNIANAEQPTVKIGLVLPSKDICPEITVYKYAYAFMDEITKYTEWQYKLVRVSADDVFSLLDKGEIDMALPMEYNPGRTAKYTYSQNEIYPDVMALFQRLTDTRFNEFDLTSINKARIGIYDNREANNYLLDFLRQYNLHPQISSYPNEDAVRHALNRGEIDLVADSATNIVSANQKPLLSYALTHSRIAALKSNAHLVKEIDDAIAICQKEAPYQQKELHRLAAYSVQPLLVHFTTEESNFIKSCPPLRVVFYGQLQPYIDYHTDGSLTGIYPDFFRLISNDTGLQFTFLHVDTYEEAASLLETNQADIIINFYANDEKIDKKFWFTNTIYTPKYMFISRLKDSFDTLEGKKILIDENSLPALSFLQSRLPNSIIASRSTLLECLNEIDANKADYVLADLRHLESEHLLAMYPNLIPAPAEAIELPVCLYIAADKPPILRSVLNKAIARMDKNAIAQLVVKNVIATPEPHSFKYLYHHYPVKMGLLTGLIFLLIGISFFASHHFLQMRRKNNELKYTLQKLRDTQKLRDEYKKDAEFDALTGCLNKGFFQKNLAAIRQEAAASEIHAAFFIIDLDHFKEANDTHGHQYGDKILRDFAHALIRLSHHGDLTGRFGGDEFVLYLREAAEENLPAIAAKILQAARNLSPHREPMITASIGICPVTSADLSYEEIFAAADEALYYVKNNGRNNFQLAEIPKL